MPTDRPYRIECVIDNGDWAIAASTSNRSGDGLYNTLADAEAAWDLKLAYWPKTRFRLLDRAGKVMREGTYHEEIHHTEKETMQMHLNKPLNVKRKTLIEKVTAFIDGKKAEHAKAEEKARDEMADAVQFFIQLLSVDADRVVNMLIANQSRVSDLLNRVLHGDMTTETAMGTVKEWPVSEVPKFVPDRDAEKLLSVLEAAVDDTIEVTPDSDLYRYL